MDDDCDEEPVTVREPVNKTKENIDICITITAIVMVAILVTSLKIIFYDKDVYPSLFASQEDSDSPSVNLTSTE